MAMATAGGWRREGKKKVVMGSAQCVRRRTNARSGNKCARRKMNARSGDARARRKVARGGRGVEGLSAIEDEGGRGGGSREGRRGHTIPNHVTHHTITLSF